LQRGRIEDGQQPPQRGGGRDRTGQPQAVAGLGGQVCDPLTTWLRSTSDTSDTAARRERVINHDYAMALLMNVEDDGRRAAVPWTGGAASSAPLGACEPDDSGGQTRSARRLDP
jgi:hypothetical protein